MIWYKLACVPTSRYREARRRASGPGSVCWTAFLMSGRKERNYSHFFKKLENALVFHSLEPELLQFVPLTVQKYFASGQLLLDALNLVPRHCGRKRPLVPGAEVEARSHSPVILDEILLNACMALVRSSLFSGGKWSREATRESSSGPLSGAALTRHHVVQFLVAPLEVLLELGLFAVPVGAVLAARKAG